MQVNEKPTAIIEPIARALVRMPVARAYCKTVAITDFVLRARGQVLSQELQSIEDPEETHGSKPLGSRLR